MLLGLLVGVEEGGYFLKPNGFCLEQGSVVSKDNALFLSLAYGVVQAARHWCG